MTDRLAIHGGPRAIREKLPTFLESAGRSFGPEEESLVLEALRSGCLSRISKAWSSFPLAISS